MAGLEPRASDCRVVCPKYVGGCESYGPFLGTLN